MSGAPDSAAQAAAADSQSSRFSSTEGEIIVFRSVDGTLFNIHRRNLQTLEILFAFVYPGVYPSVADMPYPDLALVAEAAEKYRVAPAIGMCHLAIRLGTLHNTHAIEVLQFADKHCHYDLLDLAAPYTVNMSSGDARKVMSTSLFMAWVEYRDKWLRAFRDESHGVRHRIHGSGCSNWCIVVGVVDRRVIDGTSPAIFTNLDALFDGATQGLACKGSTSHNSQITIRSQCLIQLEEWKELVRQKTSAIPPISTFISPYKT